MAIKALLDKFSALQFDGERRAVQARVASATKVTRFKESAKTYFSCCENDSSLQNDASCGFLGIFCPAKSCWQGRDAYLLKHSFMKLLRSSPFLPLASTLQAFIFPCWVVSMATVVFLALRHSFMKALRSSPFLPVASLLQVVILLCCAVLAGAAFAGAVGAVVAGAMAAGAVGAGLTGAAGAAVWASAAADRPIERTKATALKDGNFFMVTPKVKGSRVDFRPEIQTLTHVRSNSMTGYSPDDAWRDRKIRRCIR